MEVSKTGWGQNSLNRCVTHHRQFHQMRQCGFWTRGNKGTVCVPNDVKNSKKTPLTKVQGGGGMWKRDQHSFFFFRGLLDTPPPSTFLIEYVFPMLMFSENFFYINNLLLSTALCGIRFTRSIDANNSTLAIGYRRYASWVANGFRKDGSGVYWWRWGDSRGVLLYRFPAKKAEKLLLFLLWW